MGDLVILFLFLVIWFVRWAAQNRIKKHYGGPKKPAEVAGAPAQGTASPSSYPRQDIYKDKIPKAEKAPDKQDILKEFFEALAGTQPTEKKPADIDPLPFAEPQAPPQPSGPVAALESKRTQAKPMKHKKASPPHVKTAVSEEPSLDDYHLKQAGHSRIKLFAEKNSLVKGVILAEVLGRPKAYRRK